MSTTLYDRVQETTTTTGTGDLALGGAVAGYRTFASVLSNGATTPYVVVGGTEWECGVGTMSGSATLVRTTVTASSNSNSLVNFSAGTKQVFVSATASVMNGLATSSDVTSTLASYARTDQTNTFGAPQTIVSNGTGSVALVAKGYLGQSANIQEWRNSSDVAVSSVSSSGVFTGASAVATDGSNTATVDPNSITVTASGGNTTYMDPGGMGTSDGTASTTATPGEATLTDGTATTVIAPTSAVIGAGSGSQITLNAGATGVVVTGSNARVRITPTGAYVPLSVFASTTGSQNLTEWNTSGGTLLSYVTSTGVFTGDGSGLTTLNGSNVSSGTVDTARLGSGTANNTTYLRGDQTWATIPGGSSGQLQFNSSGVMGGAAALTYSTSTTNLTVQATGSTIVPLTIKGASSQTGNALEVQTSTGTPYLIMGGKRIMTANSESAITVSVQTQLGSSGQTYGLNITNAVISGGTSGTVTGVVTNANAAGTTTLAVSNQAAITVTAATTSFAQAFRGGLACIGATAVISNGYGLSIQDGFTSSGGAINTLYGIKVEDQTAGSTANYSLHLGKGQIRLGDNSASTKLGFFGATPVVKAAALTAASATATTTADSAVIDNIRTRLNELEALLQAYGLCA